MSKLPHDTEKAKKRLFLESLSQAAEMEYLLSKGSGSNEEKSLLGEHGMNPSTGKYCYSGMRVVGRRRLPKATEV